MYQGTFFNYTSVNHTKRLQTHYYCIMAAKLYQPIKCNSIVAGNNDSKLLLQVCCVHPGKSNLQHFCSLNPPREYTSFKMFAASTMQNLCSLHPAKRFQHFLFKIFAASALQHKFAPLKYFCNVLF